VRVFHYHLVTSKPRLVEARYLGKLGFELVARYGWLGEQSHWFAPGKSWDELDALGFRLRLIELRRGAVNVVVQPGLWDVPRVDHLGVALDEDAFLSALERASDLDLKIQDHPGKRTFITTEAGYRLEVHPPRDWIDEALARAGELRLEEIHLRGADPDEKAGALAQIFELASKGGDVRLGTTLVRFLPDGPEGRPELVGEVLS